MIKLIVTASSIFSLVLLCGISVVSIIGIGMILGELLDSLELKYGLKMSILVCLVLLTIVSFVIAAFLIKTGR